MQEALSSGNQRLTELHRHLVQTGWLPILVLPAGRPFRESMVLLATGIELLFDLLELYLLHLLDLAGEVALLAYEIGKLLEYLLLLGLPLLLPHESTHENHALAGDEVIYVLRTRAEYQPADVMREVIDLLRLEAGLYRPRVKELLEQVVCLFGELLFALLHPLQHLLVKLVLAE